MKIIKFQKLKNNEYKIITDKKEYKLYDDIIIKHELLLKKDISTKDMENIIEENNLLKAYYQALKYINIKLRTAKEIENYLKKKEFNEREISYAIKRLEETGYLNHKLYIESFIHDMLTLYLVGEVKIKKDLMKNGFKESEILPFLNKIDHEIYIEKIKKYIDKKGKSNKNSVALFKKKTMQELINKGFLSSDIKNCLENIELEENEDAIKKLINKQYLKYSKKYNNEECIYKIKAYLYQKGYTNVNVEDYINN